MKNSRVKILSLIITAVSAACFSSAFAQATTTSSSTNDTNRVEISFPIQKDDFLLFYGVTKDPIIDAKLTDLRKDFSTKFEDLKDQYKESFDSIVNGQKLVPSIPEETPENEADEPITSSDTISTNSKAFLKIDTASVKEKANNVIKKYVIEDSKNVITPIISVVNDRSTIKIETSSWFQKIKSWFGW